MADVEQTAADEPEGALADGAKEYAPAQDRSGDVAKGVAARGVIEGIVVALAPGLFEVATGKGIFLCTLRGRLRTRAARPAAPPGARPRPAPDCRPNPLPGAHEAPRTVSEETPVRTAPGDYVMLRQVQPGVGVIEAVLPRRSQLARARAESGGEQVMMANADLAVLVFATCAPEPNQRLLDRYLSLCEHAVVNVLICFNKVDLGIPPDVEAAAALYSSLGYTVCFTSATAGAGIGDLRARLAGHIALLTGPSGVGKSSLMNVLLPGARQRTSVISQATGKGRHTTMGARLLPLPDGGWLADSAGIRELALWNVPPKDLAHCFVELRPFVGHCLYEDCAHTAAEESCALREALARGYIAPSRFASFARLLDEARAAEPPPWAARARG